MKVVLKGEAKEIASFMLAVQEPLGQKKSTRPPTVERVQNKYAHAAADDFSDGGSYAVGITTYAGGPPSHAAVGPSTGTEGPSTVASGNYSHAEACKCCHHAVGGWLPEVQE